MREEIERMVAVGKLRQKQVEPLVTMATEGFCLHRKWGCGKINTVDTVSGKLQIDFENKPNHQMDMGFAADLLQPINKEHVLWQHQRCERQTCTVNRIKWLHHRLVDDAKQHNLMECKKHAGK